VLIYTPAAGGGAPGPGVALAGSFTSRIIKITSVVGYVLLGWLMTGR
jgi:hypothetical protein